MIYFLTPVDGGPIKIGFTDDFATRRKQLETFYGTPMVVLARMEGDRAKEREIHERFAHLRFGRTEQFRPGPDLMEFIGRPSLVGANPDAVEAMPAPPLTSLSVKLPMDVIEAARIVAAYRGEAMQDMLAEILRPALTRMEREEVARRAKGGKAK